jgi:hypothetical protein
MPFFETAPNPILHNPNLTDIAGNQYNYTTNIYSAEGRALAALRPAIREGYDVPRCMEGTRESPLKQIDIWLDDIDIGALIYIPTQDHLTLLIYI